jgi:hypothetical protein
MPDRKGFRYDPLQLEATPAESLGFIGGGQNKHIRPVTNNLSNETEEKKEKKIVSYYIELDLIKRLKRLADITNQCYSGIVSNAIREFVEQYKY